MEFGAKQNRLMNNKMRQGRRLVGRKSKS